MKNDDRRFLASHEKANEVDKKCGIPDPRSPNDDETLGLQLIDKLSEQSFSHALEQLWLELKHVENIHIFQEGSYIFETRALLGGETEKLRIPEKPEVTIIRKVEEFNSREVAIKYPELVIFQCIDLFIGSFSKSRVLTPSTQLKEMVKNIR